MQNDNEVKEMEKKRKLKRFVMPSIYVALVAILVISTFATFANMKSVNEEEKINYVSNGIWTNDTPVASVEKVIVKPYTAKDVAIGRYFYDYRDEGTQQQNAIIFYENLYKVKQLPSLKPGSCFYIHINIWSEKFRRNFL